MRAFRLELNGDRVKYAELWQAKALVSATFHEGLLYGHEGGVYAGAGRPRDTLCVVDATTGKTLAELPSMPQHYGDLCITADHVFTWNGKADRKSSRSVGGVATSGREPQLVSVNSLQYGKPRSMWMERLAPELYKQSANGESGFFGFAGMFCQGDRIYIRSTSHLYCIGPNSKDDVHAPD
jgi:hypothetical protein